MVRDLLHSEIDGRCRNEGGDLPKYHQHGSQLQFHKVQKSYLKLQTADSSNSGHAAIGKGFGISIKEGVQK